MEIDDDDDFYAPVEPQSPAPAAAAQPAPAAAPPPATKDDAKEELEEGEEEDEGGEMDEDDDSVRAPTRDARSMAAHPDADSWAPRTLTSSRSAKTAPGPLLHREWLRRQPWQMQMGVR